MGKIVFSQRGKGDKWWDWEVATLRRAKASKYDIESYKRCIELLKRFGLKDDGRLEVHRCHECYEPIFHGDLYIEDKFFAEGMYPNVHRVCLKCWNLPI